MPGLFFLFFRSLLNLGSGFFSHLTRQSWTDKEIKFLFFVFHHMQIFEFLFLRGKMMVHKIIQMRKGFLLLLFLMATTRVRRADLKGEILYLCLTPILCRFPRL